jgi:opacity protein-like surface antigen
MNYHGYVSVVFGDSHAKVRPFALGGAGVTHFGEVKTTTVAGVDRTIGGQTQFSTKWGAGVKIYPSPRVGLRVAFTWVPTYIKSDAAGWWCDPFWGCYTVGSSQYSNQFEFSGGVTFRFGGEK